MKGVPKLNYDTLPSKLCPYFHKFICFYEKIKLIEKDKDLNKLYPDLTKDVKEIFPKKSLVVKTRKELESCKIYADNMCYFTLNNTMTLSFLRHLRNAIAHDNIKYDNKRHSFSIVDFDRKRQTAMGEFKENIIYELINLLSKKYKLI